MTPGARALLQRLDAAGFFALFSLLGDGNFRPYDWEKLSPTLGAKESLWKFLLLGGSLPSASASEWLGPAALEFLRRHKLCTETGGEVSLGRLSLITHRGATFFMERALMSPGYFGEDTKALMTLVPRREAGNCLCLYPGNAAAVLPLASRSKVDITFAQGSFNPDLIAANLELNEALGKPRFVAGGAPGGRQRYDLIVAAPPCSFEPDGVEVPAFIGGGADGTKCVSEVLRSGEKLLADDGALLMTFMFFADLDGKLMRTRLNAFLEPLALDSSVIVISKHLMQPGVPIFNMIFGSVAAGKDAEGERIARKMLDHIKGLRLEAAYLLKARFSKGSGETKRDLIDCSDLYYGAWTF